MIQVIINSLVSGLLLSLVAYGFSMVFHVTRVFHLAQAGFYVVAAFIFVKFYAINIALAIGVPLISVAILAWIVEKLIYLPLFRTGSNQIISLISSIGLNILLINCIALFFGSESVTIESNISGSIIWKDIVITNSQQIQFVTCLFFLFYFGFMSQVSNIDLSIKAVASNDNLSGIVGINVPKIRLWAMILGSMLVGIVAMLITADIGTDPYAGLAITLSGAVVAILTGSVGLLPTIIVSVLLAFVQTLTERYISSQWKDGITFLILLVVMLWRTEGIISFNLRKDQN